MRTKILFASIRTLLLTMGLACFTASMARTLDTGLYDQTYYDVGADVRLGRLPNPTNTAGTFNQMPAASSLAVEEGAMMLGKVEGTALRPQQGSRGTSRRWDHAERAEAGHSPPPSYFQLTE